MAYLEWTTDLDVGVANMNDEHQKLIELMNRFAELADAGASRAQATAALDALGKYTMEHFRDEEAMMARMRFPELDKHKLIHQALLRQFGEHADNFGRTGQHQELLMFLKVWLKSHIKGVDTKYGKHAANAA